jgi:hypothetical protein
MQEGSTGPWLNSFNSNEQAGKLFKEYSGHTCIVLHGEEFKKLWEKTTTRECISFFYTNKRTERSSKPQKNEHEGKKYSHTQLTMHVSRNLERNRTWRRWSCECSGTRSLTRLCIVPVISWNWFSMLGGPNKCARGNVGTCPVIARIFGQKLATLFHNVPRRSTIRSTATRWVKSMKSMDLQLHKSWR